MNIDVYPAVEAVQLGDLLRISVRPTARVTHIPRIFKDRRQCTGNRWKRGALRDLEPYLGASCEQRWHHLAHENEIEFQSQMDAMT